MGEQRLVEKGGKRVLKVVQTRCVVAGCLEPPVEPFTTCAKHHSGGVGTAVADRGDSGSGDGTEDC